MKPSLAIIIILFIFTCSCFGQGVKCTDLLTYVKSKGTERGAVSSFQLLESAWLIRVEAWDIDGTIAVIAEIKTDDWGLTSKEYVFCNISATSWNAFAHGLYDYNTTYGERFHKYIMDYRCNCY